MRIGISTPQAGQLARPAAVRAVAAAAEQLGYASVWLTDRRSSPPGALDPLALLAATAAVTTRVRLGATVLLSKDHHPGLVARALQTLDVLSEGRLTAAVGSRGAASSDHLVADVVADVLADLVAATVAAVDALPGGCSCRPSMLIAAGPGELDLVASGGDGWLALDIPPDALARLWACVRCAAAGHGRDPDSLRLVVPAPVALSERSIDGARRPYHGSAEQVAGDVLAALDAGADEVILGVTGDPGLAQALDGYARVAEAAGGVSTLVT
jgi:alkanesulfonate monooxygenase SsuD/methylene tetrahydromethanopterin reductase-like flavin-dependent oxidoreductase (luciferase family)